MAGPDGFRRDRTLKYENPRGLHLVDRNDPVCDIVARKVIEIDRAGTRDPEEISKLAAEQLGIP